MIVMNFFSQSYYLKKGQKFGKENWFTFLVSLTLAQSGTARESGP